MSLLGIYFGPKTVSVVQTNKKKIANSIHIPCSKFYSGDEEEKIPEEVKTIAIFKDELRKSKIEGEQVSIVLSGKDLIVRTFEMPVIPLEELPAAINFEAKKYMPFKIEELILDYQLYYNKVSRKNFVLLTAIKKEIFEKYFSIFSQLDLKVVSIEYSAFSMLRLLQMSGVKDKGVSSIVNVDFNEEDEMNFVVLENGFPLFSRDIILSEKSLNESAEIEKENIEYSSILEKIKAEVRISLDFYKRKFPTKNIEKLYFVVPKDYQAELQLFLNERELSGSFVDIQKNVDKSVPFSLSLFKAFSGALLKDVKTAIKIDLLAAKSRVLSFKETGSSPKQQLEHQVGSFLQGLEIDPKFIILGLLIYGAAYGYGYYKKLPVKSELTALLNNRSQITIVDSNKSLDELNSFNAKFNEKVKSVVNLLEKQVFVTEQLEVIPKIMSTGMWFTGFSFNKKEGEKTGQLILKGIVYLGETEKESKSVTAFLGALKEENRFSKYFKKMNIISLDQEEINKTTVTNFTISCSN